jgi:SIR2-like domain
VLDPIVSLSVAVAEAPGSYAVLLGSGASRDAGVPTGGEVFWLAVEDLYRLERRESETPSRDVLKAFLTELDGGEWTYSRILQELTPDAATRRDYLAKHFEGRQPAATHELLAGLAADELIRIFVTTNFDRLLEHALQTRGIEPVVVTDEVSLASAMPREHADCYVLKPHGDYLQQTIRNTAAEIERLPKAVDAELREVFNRYGVLVLGYGGSDPAIGRGLSGRRSRYGLYWLRRGSLGADAAAIVEATGGRIIDRPDSAALLRDLRVRLEVFRAHPSGQTPEGIQGEIVAALRSDDTVAVGELLRVERRALQEVLHEATVGRENEQLTDDNIRGLHDAVAPALERRLLGLLPLVDYAPELLDAELSHLATLGERRPRADGLVFWIRSAEWAWWWLTHALGGYAVRAWRPRAMRALLDARAVERDKARPLAAGLPGETTLKVGQVMCPPAREGFYWPRPEWQYLASSLAASEALAARYPELVSGDGEPKRALGEWNLVLALALGLRGEGSFAYWSISPGAARIWPDAVDRRLRHELAEDVLAVDPEDFEAGLDEALSHSRVDAEHGDRDAARILMTGTAVT